MSAIATEIVIIALLILVNGLFSMAEMALVAARRTRLRPLAEGGDARARLALQHAESPNRYLSTVQLGITLVGVFAGVFGGATLAEQLARALAAVPALQPHGEMISITLVVLGITILTIIFGELVPKRLALLNPERAARFFARPMDRVATAVGPAVRALGGATDLVLRLLRVQPPTRARVSEEEIRILVQEGTREGVLHTMESQMLESVLALDRVLVRDILTPRARLMYLNRDDPHDAIWPKIVASNHSWFPVYADHRDNVVGIVSVKAIYANLAAGVTVHLNDLMIPPPLVPATQSVIQLLETFRQSGRHVAVATDEFGGVAGLVTLVDALEAVAGDFPPREERLKPRAVRRADGTYLVDAMIEIDQLADVLPGFTPDPAERGEYRTLAGFIVKRLAQLPREGDTLQDQGYEFEVIDMDAHRVDKVLAKPLPPEKT